MKKSDTHISVLFNTEKCSGLMCYSKKHKIEAPTQPHNEYTTLNLIMNTQHSPSNVLESEKFAEVLELVPCEGFGEDVSALSQNNAEHLLINCKKLPHCNTRQALTYIHTSIYCHNCRGILKALVVKYQ